MKKKLTNEEIENFKFESEVRCRAVDWKYGNGLPMDPLQLAVTMNQLTEDEIQECVEDYYKENNNYGF